MSFIAVPPTTPDEAVIENDGFFPDINPATARAQMRIDGTVTTERLTEALVDAMASVNADLDAWKLTHAAAGHATLADVPASSLNGISALVQRYLRAVRCLAAANLVERFRSFDTTNDGHLYADRLDATIDDLRRDARWAVRDILGQRRTTVELI